MRTSVICRATRVCALSTLTLLAAAAIVQAQDEVPDEMSSQQVLGPAVPLDGDDYLDAGMGCNCGSGYDCQSMCCGPTWSFYAGAMFLNRSSPDNDPLYQDNANPLSGSDFDLGWQAGYELELTRHDVTGRDALVARLLVIDGWSATAVASLPGNPQINTNPTIPMVGPRDIGAELTSEFISFELNYVWESQWSPAVKWLTGFRTLEVDETMAAVFVYPPGGLATMYHSVETRNRLYGFQGGADVTFYDGSAFSLRGVCTAGIYGNAAYQQSAAWDGATTSVLAIGDQAKAAFVGELGLAGKYRVADGFSFRADYRVLWASGLALAPEQVPVTNYNLGSGIDVDSTAFYHGVFLGLEWVF